MRTFPLLKVIISTLIILEIAVFIIVGSLIGVIATLLLVIASMFLGGAILRNHGLIQLQQFNQRLRMGDNPALPVFEHAIILLAGLLLIIPGFITSVIGLLLLASYFRLLVLKFLIRKNIIVTTNDQPQQPGHRVIEGEFWQNDKKD